MLNSNFVTTSLGLGAMASNSAENVLPTFLPIAVFTFFFITERRFSFWQWPKNTLQQSYRANLGLFVFNNLALSLVSLSSLLALAEHHSSHILHTYFSPLGQAVFSFLLFDLSLYVWHWASHRFP